MEFDTLITYILLFLFFILPSILKRKGKKKKAASPAKKKKPSFLNRLGEGLQTFVRELEKQAQEARQKAEKEEQGSVWDELDDRSDWPDEEILDEEIPQEIIQPKRPIPQSFDPDHPFVSPEKIPVPRPVPVTTRSEATGPTLPGISAGIPSRGLQQAIVWSEILGKPVALRNE